jgi:hypothetical protein
MAALQLLGIAGYSASLRLALHHHKRTLHPVQLIFLGLSTDEVSVRIRTAPGHGVNQKGLETILISKRINVLLGKLEPTTYFLFEDGAAYIDAQTPPSDFDVAASKRLEGVTKWGRWRQHAGKFQIKRPKKDTWEEIDGNRAIPGKRGERIDNTFINASGSANFGSHKSYVQLKSDGRFELSHKSLMVSSVVDIGPKVLASGQSDKEGARTAISTGDEVIGGGGWSKKYDGAKNTGTYKIDGYTIEMRHDNGLAHRELFFFEDKNKDTIIIGDTLFWVDKKE